MFNAYMILVVIVWPCIFKRELAKNRQYSIEETNRIIEESLLRFQKWIEKLTELKNTKPDISRLNWR